MNSKVSHNLLTIIGGAQVGELTCVGYIIAIITTTTIITPFGV